MSIIRLDVRIAFVMQCVVEKEKRGGHRQKESADTYERMVDTAIKQLIGNVRGFMKQWVGEEITAEEDDFSTEIRR